MLHIRNVFNAIVTISLIATASSGSAQREQPKSEPQAILWPEAPRPAMEIRELYTNFDGAHLPIVSVRGQSLAFEIFKRPGLSIRNADSTRFSTEISAKNMPGISMAISLFSKNEFLSDLSEETWAAYKTGLIQSGRASKIVFENSNIESPTTPYVLGANFRQVSYTTKVGSREIQIREIFAQVGDKLLVFTILGSPDSQENSWRQVDELIGEFSLS